jgi:hypothetical protein
MVTCGSCHWYHADTDTWGTCTWIEKNTPAWVHPEHDLNVRSTALMRVDAVSECPVWKQKEADNAEAMQ